MPSSSADADATAPALPAPPQATYSAALQLGLPAGQAPDAHFGRAECLQLRAEALLEAASRMPDEQLSAGVERGAQAAACLLYQECVAAYQQVRRLFRG